MQVNSMQTPLTTKPKMSSEFELILKKQGLDKLSDALQENLTTTMISSALIGSMAFSVLSSDLERARYIDDKENATFSDEVTFYFACGFYILEVLATVFAILGVLFCQGFKSQFMLISASEKEVVWFIKRWPLILPDLMVVGSITTCLLGLACAVLVLLPKVVGVALVISGTTFVLSCIAYFIKFTVLNACRRQGMMKEENDEAGLN